MGESHTPPPDWTYTENCMTCGVQYTTQYRFDTGYCSDSCEMTDDDRDE